MKKTASYFPGFQYSASELLKYITATKDYTLMLKSGEFVKFTPVDDFLFEQWLLANNIQNIRKEEGWISE
ncbi:hypothetical protein KZP23_09530 [Echinicola marina]|uniref:hypothetical protein n=1 Tax=Echinicola marina TaxID=2859768 RepID=UPI001CF613C0|nr:hypothetical protein [Echinicola marina]UCS95222.1 hypothetical protein KZP23_09530 [Echinicola marina]